MKKIIKVAKQIISFDSNVKCLEEDFDSDDVVVAFVERGVENGVVVGDDNERDEWVCELIEFDHPKMLEKLTGKYGKPEENTLLSGEIASYGWKNVEKKVTILLFDDRIFLYQEYSKH